LALLAAACGADGSPSVIRYEIADADPDVIDEGLAFSEEQGIVVGYARPYSPDYLAEPHEFNTAAFRYRESDGVVMEAATRISVPKDIEFRNRWTAYGAACVSKRVGIDYRIECRDSRGARSYTYSRALGIEEFEFECSAMRLCTYELVSSRGIFSQL
jgi:hypothetical protein